MHADELRIDATLVQQLLASQFPDWADLPLELIRPEGTDNAMFKLGSDKIVRLPRAKRFASNVEKELFWLPKLAPLLPIPIPSLLGNGSPKTSYPLPWLIFQWLRGKNPVTESLLDLPQAALDLGAFVSAMQKIDATHGPACRRGQPLITRDQETRQAIAVLGDLYDSDLLTHLWDAALATPQWSGAPTWIHGDLHAGNLLAEEGRISAVVDFGSSGIGDPACDLIVAWTLLDANSRERFRSVVQPDDATWARARGWALTFGVVAYPYYQSSNFTLAQIAKSTIDEILSENRQSS